MKKLLVNCDQVFDVLTRGPFPTGSPDDESVERHLRACHECRQLAEALRPAVSLLHEAVAADEAVDLPGYQGSLPEVASWKERVAQASTANREAGHFRADRWSQSVNALRLVAASVLAVALSLLAYGVTLSSRNEGPLRSEPRLADGQPDQRGLVRLVALRLPVTCIPERHRLLADEDASQLAIALASGSLEALRCCTECHRAGQAEGRHQQIAAVVIESCKACHRG